jgi:hypothetical protein
MLFKQRRAAPTATEAAGRLVILKYVVAYALGAPPRDMLAQMSGGWSPAERSAFEKEGQARRDAFWRPIREAGLWSSMSPRERELAGTTLGTMTHQQQVDATWRIESVRALAWALGLLEALPHCDVQAEPELLKTFATGDIGHFLNTAALRDAETIERERSLAELWHWRSRTRQLVEDGQTLRPSEPMKGVGLNTFDDIVRLTAREAAKNGRIPPAIEEDFPARGKAYRHLSAEEWAQVRSVTMERHFTLNWLCGHAPKNRWDETPTDT